MNLSTNKNPLVSVIVPAYNCKSTIEQCIDSLLNQDYDNLEIIIVDDGSTDNTLKICNRYKEKDSRIVIVHKSNAGVSAARNSGLKATHGRWCMFVDSDDWIERETISKCMEVVNQYDDALTLYMFNSKLYNGGEILQPDIYIGDIKKSDIYSAFISEGLGDFNLGRYARAVWGKIFNLEIIKNHNIRFDEELYIGEDSLFILKYIQYIDNMRVINYPGYLYRMQQTSAVRKYKRDLYRQCEIQTSKIRRIIDENNLMKGTVASSFCIYIWRTFNNLIYNDKEGILSHQIPRNSAYKEARKWYKKYKTYLHMKRINLDQMPQFMQMQYYFRYFPVRLQYVFVLAYDKYRERNKWNEYREQVN